MSTKIQSLNRTGEDRYVANKHCGQLIKDILELERLEASFAEISEKMRVVRERLYPGSVLANSTLSHYGFDVGNLVTVDGHTLRVGHVATIYVGPTPAGLEDDEVESDREALAERTAEYSEMVRIA
jgi:hypothetical protein